MAAVIMLNDLRRFAVARSLFAPTTLRRALARMRFVQADPIRAPARAQDLILRQRVHGYRAGDLERHYASLRIEEDYFVNYGFVTHKLEALMHPRPALHVPAIGNRPWSAAERKTAELLLGFVAERGEAHPREVEEHFAHGTVRNYWGGSSHATTQMLDALHYRGLLRIARRENGIRIYRSHQLPIKSLTRPLVRAHIDPLIDAVVNIYAPLPRSSLAFYVRRLRYAVPQWQSEITAGLSRARERLAQARVDGVDWFWPNEENARAAQVPDVVRFLAPFDPVVHDRTRFQLLWEWIYRFEAYTPTPKRKMGYYALPLLWGDRVIGWANLRVQDGRLKSDFGYIAAQPRERAFKHELNAELERMSTFLGLDAEKRPRRRAVAVAR